LHKNLPHEYMLPAAISTNEFPFGCRRMGLANSRSQIANISVYYL
jgi:hypothetical protein